jgi:hypothetical protein
MPECLRLDRPRRPFETRPLEPSLSRVKSRHMAPLALQAVLSALTLGALTLMTARGLGAPWAVTFPTRLLPSSARYRT